MLRAKICIIALLMLLPVTAAQAGPWSREVKSVFLSTSYERDREGNDYVGLYGEYGLSQRTTLGFELGHSSADETTGLVWLQRSLDRGDGANRWTISSGGGVLKRGEQTIPLAQLGLAWGRGFDTMPVLDRMPGGGWLAVETRLRIAGEMRDEAEIAERVANGDGFLAYVTPTTTAKADVTLGWHATPATMLINQFRLEDRADTGFSAKLASTVVHDFGPAQMELGVIVPLSGLGEPALKIGAWIEF